MTDHSIAADLADDRIPSLSGPFTIAAAATTLATVPEDCAAAFARTRALLCDDVIEPALLDRLRHHCETLPFVAEPVPGVGLREVEARPLVAAICCTLLQRPVLLRWLERVTGTTRLASVRGAVGQTRPAAGHGLGWHDDLQTGEATRRFAITLDLSSTAFDGGLFELRRRRDGHVVRYRHHRPGSALIFAIDPGYEHRLLPITAGGPRRVFAGWFHAAPAGG